jgi:hypothetical protein
VGCVWICSCPGERQIIRAITQTASAMMATQRRNSVTSLGLKGGVLCSTAVSPRQLSGMPPQGFAGDFSLSLLERLRISLIRWEICPGELKMPPRRDTL